MWENLWEEVKENHNEIILKISEYNYIIKKGNFLEHPIELDINIYYDLLASHIVSLLTEDKSLYLTPDVISVLNLNNSKIIEMIDWDIDENNMHISDTIKNIKIYNELINLCFTEKCIMLIQEICAQDIAKCGFLAKEISSILNLIFAAITYDVKGEEEVLKQLTACRENGLMKRTKIEIKYNNEYKRRGSLIYNRIFKHKQSAQNCPHKAPITNNDYALNYKVDNMYCQAAVLHIGVEKTNSSGTAFLISKDGYALTCAHVVEGAEEIVANVIVGDGYCNKKFENFGVYDVGFGEVIYTNKQLDIALLKTEYCGSEFLEIEERKLLPELGEEVVVFGYPLGYELPQTNKFGPNISFYKGYVASNQVQNGNSITFLDINVKSGNSGSPVISAKTGKVIGIISGAKVGGNMILREKMPYMIPIQHFHELNK